MGQINPSGYNYGMSPKNINPFWGEGETVEHVTATATVDDTTGTPNVSVTTEDIEDGVNLAFAFGGLKGEAGAAGQDGAPGRDGEDGVTPNITATAQVSNTTGTPTVSVTKTGTEDAPNFDFSFAGIKGEQGESGTSINGKDQTDIQTDEFNTQTSEYTSNFTLGTLADTTLQGLKIITRKLRNIFKRDGIVINDDTFNTSIRIAGVIDNENFDLPIIKGNSTYFDTTTFSQIENMAELESINLNKGNNPNNNPLQVIFSGRKSDGTRVSEILQAGFSKTVISDFASSHSGIPSVGFVFYISNDSNYIDIPIINLFANYSYAADPVINNKTGVMFIIQARVVRSGASIAMAREYNLHAAFYNEDDSPRFREGNLLFTSPRLYDTTNSTFVDLYITDQLSEPLFIIDAQFTNEYVANGYLRISDSNNDLSAGSSVYISVYTVYTGIMPL